MVVIHAMYLLLLQWRFYNHDIWNAILWFIKYNVCAIVFYRAQNCILYIMIVEAPLSEKGVHGVDAHLYILSSIYFL
jgi:hypothetical protein